MNNNKLKNIRKTYFDGHFFSIFVQCTTAHFSLKKL